ncbi:MAG: LD-carboxypeptidase [Clostridia bacterium]|nr:LD-carboxypeptidase [Clostridia bacterium]
MLAQKLKQGDTIGVIAPDKALKSTDKVYLENATKYFESLGLKVKYGKYLYSDDEYCAGTPLQRATDLNNMFSDKEVKAIFTVKGGDMVNGILPYIDFDNIKNNPKIFCGMSDITVLLCAINKMTGLITFHCQDYIWFGKDEVTDYDKNEIVDKLFNANNTIIPFDNRKFYNFKDEVIEGKIYGTNVRCLLKLLGTPYMPDLRDSILFLEGYHSDIIQWNAMLEQINQMGVLNKAIVFGYIYQLQYAKENKYDIVEELRKINADIPVVKTNDFGHRHGNSIIPIGAEATINEKEESIIVSNYLK